MNVFVDVGSHTGESTRALWLGFDRVYCWEPNPAFEHCYDGMESVVLIRAAAGVRDEIVPFYIGTDGKMQGSSICRDKLTGDISASPLDIQSFRFATWLLRLEPATVTVKMDIEGAEYAVLQDMINVRATDRVDCLLIEWHHEKIPSVSQQEHDAVVAAIGRAVANVKQWTG